MRSKKSICALVLAAACAGVQAQPAAGEAPQQRGQRVSRTLEAAAPLKKSPEQMAAYGRQIAAAIRAHIVHPEPLEGSPVAVIHVRTDAQGLIVHSELVETSGVGSWDEAVLRAVERISAVPLDVDGTAPARLELVFRAR